MEGPETVDSSTKNQHFSLWEQANSRLPPFCVFFEAFCGFLKPFGAAVVLWGNAFRT